MARKGYLEEKSIKEVLKLAERTIKAGLNDPKVSIEKKLDVSTHLYARRIPNKTEEIGKVSTLTTLNVIKTYMPEIKQKEVTVARINDGVETKSAG